MSLWSSLGKAAKGVGKVAKGALGVVGDVAKTAAPVLGFIPGVGTIAGGAIGGLGSLASDAGHGRSLNLGNALKSGAMGALGGLAGGALKGAGGIGGIASKIGQGGLGSLLKGGGQQQQGSGGPVGSGGLGKLGGIAQLGLAGLDTAQGAQQQAQAEKLRQQILTQTNAQQGDRDIARKKLMGQLGNVPQRPNLGSLFAGSSNPFSRPGI